MSKPKNQLLLVLIIAISIADSTSPNIATAVGPVLGGALTQHFGWSWIFWILVISSALSLSMIAVFLPETSRYVVGNGSHDVSGVHRTLFSYIQGLKPSLPHNGAVAAKGALPLQQSQPMPRRFRIPNPLASLRMLWAKDTAMITTIYGIYYLVFSCLQASLSPLFIDLYHLSELNAGLIYLPFGVGSVGGTYFSGNFAFSLTSRTPLFNEAS